MATMGLIPFVNSFSFLTTYRAADQFRTSIAYPGLHVIIAAHYGGLSDSYDGPTHQTVADIAWVRAIPNISVIVPSDSVEVEKALPVLVKQKGPIWLRLCRAETPIIHDSSYEFKLGKAEILRNGSDIALIGCGVAVYRILDAVDVLVKKGYDPMVISMPTIKPLDEKAIIEAAKKTGAIVTCEEHNIIGGLGAAVCEVVAKECPVYVERLGVPDRFAESGGYDQLLDRYGLSVEGICKAAEKAIARKNS
jgi:transketolase